jgi:hypothetical protein
MMFAAVVLLGEPETTNWLAELGKNSPIAAAIIAVVVIFLAHIRRRESAADKKDAAFLAYIAERDKAQLEHQRGHDASLKTLGDSCHAAQREMLARFEALNNKSAAALDRNTEAFGRTVQVLDRIEEHLDDRAGPAAKKKT